MAILLAVFYIGLAVSVPIILELRRTPAADLPERDDGGQYIDLPQGRTRYRLTNTKSGPKSGGENAPLIVLVHGLTTPSVVWQPLTGLLLARGYRVLSYDLYGRGLSDAARGAQSLAFFRRQLSDLLEQLEITGPITLVGYSMGGSIAADFAAQNTKKLVKLILLAPAGLDLETSTFNRLCRRAPIFGDWLFATLGAVALKAEGGSGPLGGVLRQQLRRRGFLAAVLSSRRGALAADMTKTHRDLAASGLPVIAIWGGADSVIPLTALGRLAQANRNAMQDVVQDAPHSLPFTHAHAVIRILGPDLSPAKAFDDRAPRRRLIIAPFDKRYIIEQ